MAIIATAVVGIAGIVATFFAPSWVQTRMERRRENRDFRRATRLVAHEARKNRTSLAALISIAEKAADDTLPESQDDFFYTEHWDRESGVLAASLNKSDWESLHYAYGLLVYARGHYDAEVELLDHGEKLSDEGRADLIEGLSEARESFERVEQSLKDAKPLTD